MCVCSVFLDNEYVRPCVIYMLRDMDIMEDLYDIRRVSALWTHSNTGHTHTHTHTKRGKLYKKSRKKVSSPSL